MASLELQRLWKLARIDNALLEIRKRAATLDVGQRISAEIAKLEADPSLVEAKTLHGEQKDLELKQQTIEDKLKRIDKEMYGGKVVSSREVENLKKETESLKRQRDTLDERLLELFELAPPAQEKAKRIETQIADAKTRLAARKKQALADKTTLETEYAKYTQARPEAAKTVPPALLARYESIRQRADGIGMVELHGQSCGGCGTLLPERTLQGLKEDKTLTCESCHRILYYTEGVV